MASDGFAFGVLFLARPTIRWDRQRRPWSDVRHFVVTSSVPERQVVWQQDGAIALALGTGENVVLSDDGSVGTHHVATANPIQCCRGFFCKRRRDRRRRFVYGWNISVCKGILYIARLVSRQRLISTHWHGIQRHGRGTKLRHSDRNTYPKTFPATFHSDGFIYAEHRTARSVLRISPVTGRIDTVAVTWPLARFVPGGLPFDAHALITSDGEFIYNVSAGVNGHTARRMERARL